VICLDTNAVIEAINQRRPEVRARLELAWAGGETIGLPAVVLYELWYGVKKSARAAANARRLRVFLTLDFEVWPFGAEDAEEAADIRAALERVGAPIGAYDVLIAAQARRRRATLVTANAKEFGRVAGLVMENWMV